VAFGQLRLLLERFELPAELPYQVVQAVEVDLQPGQLAFGPLPAAAMLGDAGGLLHELPPLLRPGLEHVVQMALADDGVERPAHAGVREQLLDVEQPARTPAQAVLAVAAPVEGPADLDLGGGQGDQAGRVVDDHLHLGQAEGLAGGAAGEDHVGHLGASQRVWTLFAQHPRDGVGDVRLPRAVRTDDDGHAGGELEDGLVRERFETAHAERTKEHLGFEA